MMTNGMKEDNGEWESQGVQRYDTHTFFLLELMKYFRVCNSQFSKHNYWPNSESDKCISVHTDNVQTVDVSAC